MTSKPIVPLPVPYDPDSESPPTDTWLGELFYAEEGQLEPLVDALRSGKAIPANEEWPLREFLSAIISRERKLPKRRPYHDRTWGQIGPKVPEDFTIIKKSYAGVCAAAGEVWKLKASGMSHRKALEAAWEKFGIESEAAREQVADFLRRSIKDRKRLVTP